MSVYPIENEKRQHRRLPAINLFADIKAKKGLFAKWQTVRALDYNIHGTALVMPNEPELGSRIHIKLKLEMDMAEINVNEIEGKVVNKVMLDPAKGEWRVGFIFSGQSKHSKETSKQLLRINEYYERNNLLKSKIKPNS